MCFLLHFKRVLILVSTCSTWTKHIDESHYPCKSIDARTIFHFNFLYSARSLLPKWSNFFRSAPSSSVPHCQNEERQRHFQCPVSTSVLAPNKHSLYSFTYTSPSEYLTSSRLGKFQRKKKKKKKLSCRIFAFEPRKIKRPSPGRRITRDGDDWDEEDGDD